jgi:hypothetical protein
LRSVEAFACTGEAAFAGYGEKNLQFAQIHGFGPRGQYKPELSKVE